VPYFGIRQNARSGCEAAPAGQAAFVARAWRPLQPQGDATVHELECARPRACQACLCRRPDARIGDRVRITPPFRLALRAGPLRVPLGGELPGEETFVQQRYMETEGPGSLRISRVGRFGEKKVAGSTFVHMKL